MTSTHGISAAGAADRLPGVASTALAKSFDGSLILIAEAAYHVDELGPLYDVLVRRGVKARFMAGARQLDSTTMALGRYVDEILPFDPELVGTRRWSRRAQRLGPFAPSARCLQRRRSSNLRQGRRSAGLRRRRHRAAALPYLAAAVVLGQGQNDFDALPERQVRIVGSTRLERIWQASPASLGRHALVNLNFTYRVLEDTGGRG